MKMASLHATRRTRPGLVDLSRWVLALCLAGSALAVGTVHTVTLCVVTAGLGLSAALAWWNGEPMSARPAATLLLFVGVGLVLVTALQAVPIPARWLAAVAPHNADVWSRALAPFRESGPSWAPVSLDPGATRVEVLKGVAYVLAFLSALRLARKREGARFLSGAIVLTGLVLAAAALLHPAFGAHKLFGVYEPGPGIADRHIAPLMNPNNLAGYLNICICLALAAALAPEPVVPRSIAAAIVLLLGATQVWVASRGGVVTMALGVLIVLAIARFTRSRERGSGARLSLALGAVAAAGVAMVALGGSDDASSELLESDVSKLKMFAQAMRMFPAVSIFGCGRGAFESAFPAFRATAGHMTVAYPENVAAQWILEWGLPVGLAALVALAFALRPGAVLARSATASGAWAAIVAVTVQNLGDLGSEIPGLVLAGAVCAAIVVAGTPGHRLRWGVERWAKAPQRVAIAAAVMAAIGIPVAAYGVGHELHDDRRALHDAALERHVPAEVIRGLARDAMLRHPAEPYLPFIVGLRASYARDDNPIPWAGATLDRARVYGPAHLVLARAVTSRSPSQARLEYRLAMQDTPLLERAVMAEAPRLVGGFRDAMELVPQGAGGVRVLEMLAGELKDRLPATRMRIDAELTARAPTKAGPAERAAIDAVDDVESGGAAPWCEGEFRPVCLRGALEKAKRAEQLAPGECLAHAMRARARIAAGETTPALRELQNATDAVSDRVGCLQMLEEIAQASGETALAQAVRDQIVAAGCSDDKECAQELWWVAVKEETAGNPRKALALYKRAYEREPNNDSLLESIARLASQTGLHVEAAETYERLARRHPKDPRWKTAGDAEREAAVRAVVKL